MSKFTMVPSMTSEDPSFYNMLRNVRNSSGTFETIASLHEVFSATKKKKYFHALFHPVIIGRAHMIIVKDKQLRTTQCPHKEKKTVKDTSITK